MNSRTASSSDVAELRFSGGFLSCKANAAPRIISLSPLSLATDVTDATLGADLWLGTRTGAGDTATPTESFIGRSPWLHEQQVAHFCVRTTGREASSWPELCK